jgi:hypothetical protein
LTINVRVRGHFEITDEGRKIYGGRQHVKTIVDINSFTLMQLIDFIGTDFVWNSKQFISLHRGEIRSDEPLKQWLDANLEKRVEHIEAQINDFQVHCNAHPQSECFILKWKILSNLHLTKKCKKVKKCSDCEHDDEVVSDSSYDTDITSSPDLELDSNYASDIDILDSDEGDDITEFSYDVDDPCIDVDVVFSDVD